MSSMLTSRETGPGIRDLLEPGDMLLDSGGYPAVEHFGPGTSAMIVSSYELFLRTANGDVSPKEYAGIVANHVAVQLAYDFNYPLPEGATILKPAPTETDGLS